MEDIRHNKILDLYVGESNRILKKKTETETFSTGYVNNNSIGYKKPADYNYFEHRDFDFKAQNNVLPFEQVRDRKEKPHIFRIKEKNIDEMRNINDPKTSYVVPIINKFDIKSNNIPNWIPNQKPKKKFESDSVFNTFSNASFIWKQTPNSNYIKNTDNTLMTDNFTNANPNCLKSYTGSDFFEWLRSLTTIVYDWITNAFSSISQLPTLSTLQTSKQNIITNQNHNITNHVIGPSLQWLTTEKTNIKAIWTNANIDKTSLLPISQSIDINKQLLSQITPINIENFDTNMPNYKKQWNSKLCVWNITKINNDDINKNGFIYASPIDNKISIPMRWLGVKQENIFTPSHSTSGNTKSSVSWINAINFDFFTSIPNLKKNDWTKISVKSVNPSIWKHSEKLQNHIIDDNNKIGLSSINVNNTETFIDLPNHINNTSTKLSLWTINAHNKTDTINTPNAIVNDWTKQQISKINDAKWKENNKMTPTFNLESNKIGLKSINTHNVVTDNKTEIYKNIDSNKISLKQINVHNGVKDKKGEIYKNIESNKMGLKSINTHNKTADKKGEIYKNIETNKLGLKQMNTYNKTTDKKSEIYKNIDSNKIGMKQMNTLNMIPNNLKQNDVSEYYSFWGHQKD